MYHETERSMYRGLLQLPNRVQMSLLIVFNVFTAPPLPSNVTVTFNNITSVQIQWDKPKEEVANCLTNYVMELYTVPADCVGSAEKFACMKKVYQLTTVDNSATLSAAVLNNCAWYAVSVTPNQDIRQVDDKQRVGAKFSVAKQTGKCTTVLSKFVYFHTLCFLYMCVLVCARLCVCKF